MRISDWSSDVCSSDLPLFEERLATLFDHIDPATPVLRGHRTDATAETRFEAIRDYHANRVAAEKEQEGRYRPVGLEAWCLTDRKRVVEGKRVARRGS